MDYQRIIVQNEMAWNMRVDNEVCWTVPVSPEEIEKARRGIFQITLTATKYVPREWFPQEMKGLKILCLACGGGQQAQKAIEFSHTLESLIGGQTKTGFLITDFYEDIDEDPICQYSAKYFASRAIK